MAIEELGKILVAVVISSVISAGGTLLSVNNQMNSIGNSVSLIKNEQMHIKEDVSEVKEIGEDNRKVLATILLELRKIK